jgi:hypothetical protein
MPERASVNQRIQIGVESASGTGVTATKIVECFDFKPAIKADAKTYRGTGRRWASVAEENREWMEIPVSGNLDYQGIVYMISGPFGAATITTHPTGTLSKDWVWTPALTGAITPKTYTIEQGDAVRAHKWVYGLFTSWGYKGSRADFTCDGTMIGQLLQDNITMTSSPTTVALAPVVGKHVNLYVDATSGGIGGTQFTKAFTIEYKYDGGFGPFWALNRTNTSWTGHVDIAPKNTFKMTVEADSQGMGPIANLQAGSTIYVRVDAVGPIIEATIPYAMQHDMACKVLNVDPFGDQDGIFTIGYECEIIEDAAWSTGQSQKLTVTNQVAAL